MSSANWNRKLYSKFDNSTFFHIFDINNLSADVWQANINQATYWLSSNMNISLFLSRCSHFHHLLLSLFWGFWKRTRCQRYSQISFIELPHIQSMSPETLLDQSRTVWQSKGAFVWHVVCVFVRRQLSGFPLSTNARMQWYSHHLNAVKNQFHTGIACVQFILSREDWLKSASAEREKKNKNIMEPPKCGDLLAWLSCVEFSPYYAQNADNVSEMFPFKFP